MKRVFWLDLSRFIAILLVVFTHIHEQLGDGGNLLLKSLFYNIDRLGVPIFFMISGGLILPRAANLPLLQFYKKRIPQFILLTIVYSIITTTSFKFTQGIDILTAFKEALLKHNGIYPANTGSGHHLWFMYSIIGLYLIAPFLAKTLDKLSNKEIVFFIFLCVIQYQFTASIYARHPGQLEFFTRLGNNLLGEYISYFLIGYLFINRNLKINNYISIVLFTLPIILITKYELNINHFIDAFHWYSSSISIFISSIGLLSLIKNLSKNKHSNFIEKVSLYSFGIYLSHYIFIYLLKGYLEPQLNVMPLSIKLALLLFLDFMCSFIFVSIMYRNRFTKYLVS